MQRTVKTPLGEIKFILIYKRVKNINLRITRAGEVLVSAPKRVSAEFIDAFVISKSDFIFRAKRRVSTAPRAPISYADSDKFVILGKEYTLRVEAGKRSSVAEQGDTLILTIKPNTDTAMRKKLLDGYRQARFSELCAELLLKNMPPFLGRGIEKPPLFFREMRSRFGSCHTKKRTVTLAKSLAQCPPSLIEYVIAHELCHLIHPNHSKDFYRELSSLMPDFKERRMALRAFSFE